MESLEIVVGGGGGGARAVPEPQDILSYQTACEKEFTQKETHRR